MTRPELTDRAALRRQRARAARRPGGPARFLHDAAIAEVEERLAEVNRAFTAPAVVTGWPALWGPAFPAARLVPDDDILALAPGAHDLVIHALALHWATDPVGQIIQSARALGPDGLFIAVFPGGRTLALLRACLAEAEAQVAGGLSPRVLPMAELGEAGGLLQRAGLAMPVADVSALTVSYPGPRALMADLRAMGEANALAARARRFTRRDVLGEAERRYAAAAGSADGRVNARFELFFLTGWAPGPGQPRPLRPGSATARLADALGAVEWPAGAAGAAGAGDATGAGDAAGAADSGAG
ncbi:MAG: SAM-dependent methyltransferase [Rhodobacteraceae bacterium]|nr:SAM-dependent methyltransferase [Paracoccaceae bacterium]